MAFFWIYVLVTVVALLWVGVDSNASGAFEFIRRNNRETARDMGMYSEFVRYSLGRLLSLATLAILSAVASSLVFARNPFDFGTATRSTLLGAMLTGSLMLFVLPFLADRLRFRRFLYVKTTQLAELITLAASESEVQRIWDIAEYETSGGWTAWHPKMEDYEHKKLWAGMDPVVYLRAGIEPSVVVPIRFEYFLAWKFKEEIKPGDSLPFTGPGNTQFIVTTVHQIGGRQGWSIIRAEMDLDFVDAAA